MPRIQFHQRLHDLKDRLLAQAALAQQALDCVLDAYAGSDLGLCQHVMDNEHAINSSERLIDQAAYDLLAMEQPNGECGAGIGRKASYIQGGGGAVGRRYP